MEHKTRLSVNINKVALIRNSRGSNLPDLVKVAKDCELFGAEGITVHPRPDERHVKYSDVPALGPIVTTEFNIEGNPQHRPFMDLVLKHKPHQCTLVPDAQTTLTSDNGWDTVTHADYLKDIIAELHAENIRVSIFVNAYPKYIEGAKEVGADRIELYTGPYAEHYAQNPEVSIAPYIKAAEVANAVGVGINAGHDLNLENLRYFKDNIPGLLEVSIGHALISDALYFGLQNTIQMYLQRLT
ncbi:MAG: pyridoxine 5'-phosphate synthase [Aureispira sp.]|nr:pyridoxine 5'-phosphate synthase [Aureispira sp.]